VTSNPIHRSAWVHAALALLGFGIFGYATGVLMAPAAAVIGDRVGDLTCLQLAFTAERALAVLDTFPPEQRAVIPQLPVPGDIVFALGLRAVVDRSAGPRHAAAAGKLATRRLDHHLDTAARLGPRRDRGHLPVLYRDGWAGGGHRWGGAGGGARGQREVPVSLGYRAGLGGIAASLKGFTVDRRIGAVLLYLFTIAFIARPLAQIPACF
jgi:hypothetical protein